MADLAENVAVITGASSGIGHATALELAKQGYNLVLAARRQHVLKEVAKECELEGVRTATLQTDVANEEDVQKILRIARRTFGHIDVWINNAGVYLAGKFEDVPMADIKRLLDVNFYGTVYGSRAALEQFRTQGYGTLINISSVNAAAPQPYVGIYSASKAAIRALDESLRMELRLEGLHKLINVCTVMPAAIDTNLFQNSANYTGKQLLALEPVYAATYAAKQIARLASFPRREIKIGPAGRFMALQNAHSPRSYEKRLGNFTEKDLLDEQAAEASPGNLYEPIETNTGVSGGWRETRLRADQMNLRLGTALGITAGLAGLGLYLINHKSER